MRRAGLAGLDSALVRFLTYGRGVDATRMRTELGFEPAYTTEEAFADFVSRARGGLFDHGRIEAVERVLRRILTGEPDLDVAAGTGVGGVTRLADHGRHR
jgi:UDP-glucose 4-epimerase